LNTEHASCCCGNIEAKVELSVPISNFTPRACDCNFCTKHGAAYIADPSGKLTIQIKNPNEIVKYKHGSEIADFITCKLCGVFVAVTYSLEEQLLGSLNSRTLENISDLPEPNNVSPKFLPDTDKIGRWQQIWFQNVTIANSEASQIAAD
jgi:hypothetical protein